MLSAGGACYSFFTGKHKLGQTLGPCPYILLLADIMLGIALIIIGALGLSHTIALNSIGSGVVIGIGCLQIFMAPTMCCGCAIAKTILISCRWDALHSSS